MLKTWDATYTLQIKSTTPILVPWNKDITMYTNLEDDAKSSVDDVRAFLAGNKSSAGLSSIL